MSFYKSILNQLFLPIGDKFFGGNYLGHIREWRDLDRLSEVEIRSIQEEKLQKILNYARINVPYYKTKGEKNNLEDFPILTKEKLRDHSEDLVSKAYDVSTLEKHHSSGSSGIQSFTYMTKAHTFYLRALQTHWWNWSGYSIGDPLLQFGISQKRTLLKKFKDVFYRCIYVKAFGLSETELLKLCSTISKYKTIYIAGYPSVINQLAKICIAHNAKTSVKGIICFGDKLFEHYKENIKTAFGENIKLIDTYGCAEGLLMACKYDLEYYYIMAPHVYIEIVDDNGRAVEDGCMGHVLVTGLANYGMPLIRYKLGDLAIKLPLLSYPKKRAFNYPLLQKIIGRETDIVKTRDGIILNVHTFTGILEYYSELKQYKIVQNDLENIIIEYIVDYNYDFDPNIIDEIRSKLIHLTKSNLVITFKKVDEIIPLKSGKPQIIESNLKDV